MAENLKVLAQGVSTGGLTSLYTCPSAGGAVVSTLYVCNRTAGTLHFRISVAVGGVADSVEQYVYYDTAIPPNETFASTTGISMAQTDEVRSFGDAVGLSFTLFGVEKT